ncbi:MAG: hypothetical protein PVF15_09880 [Candidatus Bathyarchaeota archaeon]|jgi:hypothetical protein
MRKQILVSLTIFFFFLEIWFASQTHLPPSPKVSESNEAFGFEPELNFELHQMNVIQPSLQVAGQLLTISSERGEDGLAWSIFEGYVDVNVPFRRDLKLRYAMFTSQLNLDTDAVRLRFFLVNGTHFVVLAYEIGFTEEDSLPDPDSKNYSYIFFQIGNNTNTWFNDERSLWNDLINKGLSLETSWRVARITFGVMSYRKDPDIADYMMEGVLKLDDNSLYYENLLKAEITSTDSQVSQYAVAGMIISLVSFFVCSSVTVKMSRSKNSGSKDRARSSLYSLDTGPFFWRTHIPHSRRDKHHIQVFIR